MHKELLIGLSFVLIGIYNFILFYSQQKLYIYNGSIYLTLVLIGLLQIISKKSIQIKQKKVTLKTVQNNQEIFLKEIESNSVRYTQIQNMMKEIKINKIFKIMNKNLKEKFKIYQNQISQKCKINGDAGISNTNYMFHGTLKLCDDNTKLCTNQQCSICNISKIGFKLKFAGKGIATNQRFGYGLYFTPDYKKSLEYQNNQSGLKKQLILSKVIQGRIYYTKDKEDYLDDFNQNNFDSIFAHPQNRSDLTYSEICVFNEHACLPRFIIYFK